MKLTGTEWYADKREKRDAAERALAAETDPKRRRSLRARRDRYQVMLTMGPEGTSEATTKANETRGAEFTGSNRMQRV
jgi:hypothetical protein